MLDPRKDGDLDEAEALDTGADDYITKPFSFAVLVARVRALLRRSGGRDPAPIEAGDLRIGPGQRRVWRGDSEIDLTARQFDVLEFLIRRAGQVLSTAGRSSSGVMEYEFDGGPNIVEVYVRRLRTRIDEPFGRHTIETIPRRRVPPRRRRGLTDGPPQYPVAVRRGSGRGRRCRPRHCRLCACRAAARRPHRHAVGCVNLFGGPDDVEAPAGKEEGGVARIGEDSATASAGWSRSTGW